MIFKFEYRDRISKISEIGEYKKRGDRLRSPLFFSHCINIYNTIYILNFYFVILSILSISFMSFSISTNSPNITIFALLISSFTISFNLSILYPLYRQIRIIQIPKLSVDFKYILLCVESTNNTVCCGLIL